MDGDSGYILDVVWHRHRPSTRCPRHQEVSRAVDKATRPRVRQDCSSQVQFLGNAPSFNDGLLRTDISTHYGGQSDPNFHRCQFATRPIRSI